MGERDQTKLYFYEGNSYAFTATLLLFLTFPRPKKGLCVCVCVCVCERERERERERIKQDEIILLSLRPIPTGVNIQAIRILVDQMTDLNSVF